MNSPESFELGQDSSQVDFDMAWAMAHAGKPDRDEAAELRQRADSLVASKNPIRMVQRYSAVKDSEIADYRAEAVEESTKYEQDKLHFYEQLKESGAVRDLYATSAHRAEAFLSLAELAKVLRANNAATAVELASGPHDAGHAAVKLIEQIGGHLAIPEAGETKVKLGFEDMIEGLTALGLVDSINPCRMKLDQGRSAFLRCPDSNVTIELAATEEMVRKPGSASLRSSDNYMLERHVVAFIDTDRG